MKRIVLGIVLGFVALNVHAKNKITEKDCDRKANLIGVFYSMKTGGIDVKNFNTSEDSQMPIRTRELVKEAIPIIYDNENRGKLPQEIYVQYLEQCLKDNNIKVK